MLMLFLQFAFAAPRWTKILLMQVKGEQALLSYSAEPPPYHSMPNIIKVNASKQKQNMFKTVVLVNFIS